MTARVFALAVLLAVPAGAATAAEANLIETPAQHAILLDYDTGTVLFSKEADVPMPPSSMSKLMTVYMLFERMADGRLKPDDTFPVSEKAWRMGGSKMFVEVGNQARIEDLAQGIIVQSGNDACIVVAEGIAGSETAFADMLNDKAKQLGMTHSHFVNASGWPDPNHLTSARDLAVLARHLIKDFPQYYPYFAETSFTYNGIRQGNRNPLLYKNIGADGLKTGHTEAAGYGLVASAVSGGQRLILVVNGLSSVSERSRESDRLLGWGFREFERYDLFKAGEQVSEAEIWLGDSEMVPLVIEEPLQLVMARTGRKEMTATVVYDGPIPAPIAKGQQIATLRISAPGFETVERPLVAGEDVSQLGPVGRLGAALRHLVLGGSNR